MDAACFALSIVRCGEGLIVPPKDEILNRDLLSPEGGRNPELGLARALQCHPSTSVPKVVDPHFASLPVFRGK
jgi:hypothetical protein